MVPEALTESMIAAGLAGEMPTSAQGTTCRCLNEALDMSTGDRSNIPNNAMQSSLRVANLPSDHGLH